MNFEDDSVNIIMIVHRMLKYGSILTSNRI